MVERFLTRTEVAEILNITDSQAYRLVRSGELPAIRIGGRGQWRIERAQLESYLERRSGQAGDAGPDARPGDPAGGDDRDHPDGTADHSR